MKLKQSLLVLALLSASLAAQATTTTTTVGNTTTYTNDFNSGDFDSYLTLFNGDTFSFNFSTAAVSSVEISFWYSMPVIGGGGVTLGGFSDALTYTTPLFDGSTDVSKFLSVLQFAANNPGPDGGGILDPFDADANYGKSLSGIASGNYTLNIHADQGLKGLKIDDLKVVVTAVPEPDSYAMLLAGLGIVGAIARRRLAK